MIYAVHSCSTHLFYLRAFISRGSSHLAASLWKKTEPSVPWKKTTNRNNLHLFLTHQSRRQEGQPQTLQKSNIFTKILVVQERAAGAHFFCEHSCDVTHLHSPIDTWNGPLSDDDLASGFAKIHFSITVNRIYTKTWHTITLYNELIILFSKGRLNVFYHVFLLLVFSSLWFST